MDKYNTRSRLLADIEIYESYIRDNFKESSHDTVDSGTLYSFGKQTFYVLNDIIEALNDIT